MGAFGDVEFSDLENVREWLRQLCDSDEELDDFYKDCALELTGELIQKVIKRTPVGHYPKKSGKKGGTLKGNWTVGEPGCAEAIASQGSTGPRATAKIDNLGNLHLVQANPGSANPTVRDVVVKEGSTYYTEVFNPTEYASYVEYGHRIPKKDGYGWQPARFMMTKSAELIRQIAPAILDKKVEQFIKDHTEW